MKILSLLIILLSLALGSCSSETTPDKKTQKSEVDSKTAIYQCPMDTEVKSAKAGSCPKCGMDLEKITPDK
jgi:PBP1b-binding outer membrane lipoprotein LpoB